jgi:uncharacterized protein YlxW (UPF0749 family)
MEKNFSPIKQRILLYADNKGYSKRKIYLDTGISNGVLDKESGLTEDNIERFVSTYKDVNIEWLLTGNGDMLRHQDSPKPTIDTNRLDELNEIIDIQRKLIKNLEAEVKRLEKELEKNQNFSSSHMAADEELNYTRKKR